MGESEEFFAVQPSHNVWAFLLWNSECTTALESKLSLSTAQGDQLRAL